MSHHTMKAEETVFTLDLARAHIRDLHREGDEARRNAVRERRRHRRFGRKH